MRSRECWPGRLSWKVEWKLSGQAAHGRVGPACDHWESMRRNPEELRGISDEVLYELQMLFGTAQALRDGIQGAKQGAMSWPQKMACIESFAIHSRVLEAFLWDRPRKAYPDDALAIDFFDDGMWESIRERVQRSALDDLRPGPVTR